MPLTDEEIEDKITDMLAIIYKEIPWNKINTGKDKEDIFNHRVRSASRRQTLGEFVSKLCNYFGLQSMPPELIPIIDELKPYEVKALLLIYKEHITICSKAILKAEESKKSKSKKKANSKTATLTNCIRGE